MRAVVVTNDPDGLAEIREAWEGDGIQTEIVTEVERARHILHADVADLVVFDFTLSRGDAVQLYNAVRTRDNAISMPIIFRCGGIEPPWWAVRDYYLPPEVGTGVLRVLSQEILRSAQRDDARSVDDLLLHLERGRDGNGGSDERSATTALLVTPPRRNARQTRVRAVRGRNSQLRAVVTQPERSGIATLPSLARPSRSTPADSDMSLPRFLLRWSWVLLLMAVLGLAGGYAFLLYGPLKYQSTALLVMPPQTDVNGQPMVASNPTRIGAAAQALAGQANSPYVHEAARRALSGRLNVATDDISMLVSSGRIAITPVGTSGFISITASDADPDTAWLLADGYARGVLLALDAQSQVVTAQQRTELQTRIEILKSQLASVPSSGAGNVGSDEMFVSVQKGVFESLLDAQTKLRMLAQAPSPLARYGETSAPVQALNERRVLIAGAAAGGAIGLGLAYLLELVRQWAKQRRLHGRSSEARATSLR